MEKEKNKRKVWSKADTLLLLKCYGERKEEFKHARKRKHAYENVLEDMLFQGFQDVTVNAKGLESKMRTLTQAYKSAKDNERQTGAAPSIVPYMNEMEEIFGETSLVTNDHTLAFGSEESHVPNVVSGIESFRTIIEADEDGRLLSSTPVYAEWLMDEGEDEGPSTSAQATSNNNRRSASSEPTTSNSNSTITSVRPRKSARERYFEKKLEIAKAHAEEKKNFFNDMRNIGEKFIQIEEEKLKTLQEMRNN